MEFRKSRSSQWVASFGQMRYKRPLKSLIDAPLWEKVLQHNQLEFCGMFQRIKVVRCDEVVKSTRRPHTGANGGVIVRITA